ncbi:MAG: DcaP family trimeric outer membrane transporter [Asticcacaulis sp.]
MRYNLTGLAAVAGLALAGTASAQDTSVLEKRLAAMEGEMTAMRAELVQLRADKAAADSKAQAAKPDITPKPADGFKTGDTTVKIGGFIKTSALFSRYDSGDLSTGSLGRDFYLPSQIPVGGVSEHSDADLIAKQTRLTLSFNGASGVGGYIEADFQTTPGSGSERTTNGYNFALRRAYVTYGNWLFGQDWTTFQNVAALPESTDFIGPTEGTVFVRQPQVRYTWAFKNGLSLAMAAENPETASITPASTTMVENDDDRVPDVTARLSLRKPYGDFAVAVLARQLSVDNGAVGDTATGYGLSLSGKVPFGVGKKNDVRFMLTGGEGIGRYVGLNFAPDVVYAGTAGSKMETVEVLSGFVAIKASWSARLRSTFTASALEADYPAASPATASKSARSLAANLFFTPAKGLDLGVEIRTGERELVNGQTGRLDRIELAAKYAY